MRSRATTSITTALITSITLGGCSLFTSFGGLSNGDRPDPASDGSSSSGDGGGLSDGTSALDGADALLPIGGFCAAHTAALFCVDFDRSGQQILDGWSGDDISPGSNLSLDDTMSASPPRSMRITMPARPESGYFFGLLEKTFSVTERRPLRLEMDVYLVKPVWPGGSTGNVSIFSVTYDGANRVSNDFFVQNGQVLITAATPNLVYTISDQDISVNAWTHVRLEMDFRTMDGGGWIKLWFGSPPVLVIDRAGLDFAQGATSELKLNLGLARYNETTPAFDIRFDNVLLELL